MTYKSNGAQILKLFRIYESKPIMFLFSQKISADLKGPKLKYKLCYGPSKIAKLCFLPLVMCCLLLWQLG